ncbi:MAG TPA: amidohydrolase [Candidatus Babeliales bacterium]|nr:amidohydrolase [Candidatus Babeliales bacterium]
MGSPITVYTAKKIVTMDPSAPAATAVAVRDGMILGVGSVDDLKPWLESAPHEIVSDFAQKVLMPGLIDPHLHPFMAAAMMMSDLIVAFEWRLPWGTVKRTRGREAYLAELRRIEAAKPDPSEPLVTWGYDPLWHGDVTRRDLDEISKTRPIVVWHRAAHQMYLNSAALAHWSLTETEARGNPNVNYQEGHYWEAGMIELAAPKMASFMFEPKRYLEGVSRVRDVVSFGGITTIAEMSFGITNADLEWLGPSRVLDTQDVPFRTYFVADAKTPAMTMGPENSLAWADALPQRNTSRLRFLRHVKLFADGAFYSQGMRLGGACYIDGHSGEWMTPPALFEQLAALYWNAGYQIHVHTNGDEAVGFVLQTLQKLLEGKPRFDHRFTIEHFGYCASDQIRKLARLGAIVSANPYYLYETGDAYSRVGLGADRASQIARLASVARAGVPLALHSDFAMAPAQPLLLAQIAATRRTAEGTTLCSEEALTLDQALRGITIDAAFVLGAENEIGSIASGKRADFTVLEEDPYEAGAEHLSDIPISGTIFEGRPFEQRPTLTDASVTKEHRDDG